MRNNNFLSNLIAARSLVTKICLVLAVGGIALGAFYSWVWASVIIAVSLALLLLVQSLVIVQPGFAGYLKVLEVLQPKSYQAGIHIVWPFISTMKEVDVRLKNHTDTNMMKAEGLREIRIKYAMTYTANENVVHLLHRYIGEDRYEQEALCPWLDATFTAVIAGKSYEYINGHMKDLQHEVEDAYRGKVERECLALCGRELFSNIKVAIIDIQFDDDFTKAVSELAKTQKEKDIIEAKAEQLKITAQAKAEALKIQAEAEAEAFRLKGASENEVKEKLGEILKTHPELLKEVLAKNFPKVYGGNSIINLDDLLGSGS